MNIEFVDEISSTNDVLLERAFSGEATSECALVAFCQTKGKGRKGREFYSPSETGLYLSILLFPKIPIEEVLKLTPLMAVAAARALEEYSKEQIDIKWVNDLYKNGKKIGGILTECSPEIIKGIPKYIVIGIGINLFPPEGGFPKEIKDRAGALYDKNAAAIGDIKTLKKNIAASMIETFEGYYLDFPNKDYLEEYRDRLFIIGKEVSISDGRRGTVLGIDENFGLKIGFSNGEVDVLSAGEVSLSL